MADENFNRYLREMEQGSVDAGVEVARAYLHGWGVEEDKKRGADILERYVEEGRANARVYSELGAVYLGGFGGRPQDIIKAGDYYGIAAGMGDASALSFLEGMADLLGEAVEG